ncbi:nucleotidyltransferase family protein [Anaerobaca lacustris]|uniref:Nucleotidyltransferase family protein n=1 Tax=Anaerobaca lacustris TaxID=3044600 RepID=A0AAW6U0L1_9BACT|nr:nucleotidyltransferase family protein [Sedimentisphaerales bacterium M17dextr]
MSAVTEQIRQATLAILQRYGVARAALFGSATGNRLRPDSDVDILVQIDRDIGLLDFVALKMELQDALGRKVDLVEYDAIKPRLRDSILSNQEPIL